MLSRCAGIGENIKVKTKRFGEKPQATLLLPVQVFMSAGLKGRGVYLHTQVCARLCVCVRFTACSYKCILVFVFIFISE